MFQRQLKINKVPSDSFSFMGKESKLFETSFPVSYPEDCGVIILDGTAYLKGLGKTRSFYYW